MEFPCEIEKKKKSFEILRHTKFFMISNSIKKGGEGLNLGNYDVLLGGSLN